MLDQNEIVSDVSVLKEKVSNHDNRIQGLEVKNESLARLTTLMEIQVETNREQNKQMKDFQVTLVKINSNLDGLNKGLANVENRVGELERTQTDNKIDVSRLIRNIAIAIITGAVVYYALHGIGIKN